MCGGGGGGGGVAHGVLLDDMNRVQHQVSLRNKSTTCQSFESRFIDTKSMDISGERNQ